MFHRKFETSFKENRFAGESLIICVEVAGVEANFIFRGWNVCKPFQRICRVNIRVHKTLRVGSAGAYQIDIILRFLQRADLNFTLRCP